MLWNIYRILYELWMLLHGDAGEDNGPKGAAALTAFGSLRHLTLNGVGPFQLFDLFLYFPLRPTFRAFGSTTTPTTVTPAPMMPTRFLSFFLAAAAAANGELTFCCSLLSTMS